MSNRERAAEVAAEFLNGNVFAANIITKRLADAGLLAPDLPEPTVYKDGAEVEWDTPRGYVNVENGVIEVAYRHHAAPTIAANTLIVNDRDAARAIGHALLAAANYKEEGQ